jgi:hypothetical protein
MVVLSALFKGRVQTAFVQRYSTSPSTTTTTATHSQPTSPSSPSSPDQQQSQPSSSPPDEPHPIPHSTPATFFPIIHADFWASLVPKPFRRDPSVKKSSSSEWNPMTFYIWMALLIGSASVNQIAERRGFAEFSRKTEARVAELREVLGRVQRGGQVDERLGSGVLGAGGEDVEREWADGECFFFFLGGGGRVREDMVKMLTMEWW